MASATLLYNGLEEPVRVKLLPSEWAGTKIVNLSALRDLGHEIGDIDSLPLKKRK